MNYPFIGKGQNGALVLFYSQQCGTVLGSGCSSYDVGYYSESFIVSLFTNITADYLRNTKIKIESPEHSEMIQNLVFGAGGSWCNSGVKVCNLDKERLYIDDKLIIEHVRRGDFFKLNYAREITLPLPPKSDQEWPQVGDKVFIDDIFNLDDLHRFGGEECDVISIGTHDSKKVVTVSYRKLGVGAFIMGEWIKKPKTESEKLRDEIASVVSRKLADELISKYDIKKKAG